MCPKKRRIYGTDVAVLLNFLRAAAYVLFLNLL